MFEWLSVHVDDISLLWLFPILFMFHDFEEILFVESWNAKYGEQIKEDIPPYMRRMYSTMTRMTTRNFAVDVLFVYILVVMVTCIAVFFSFYLLYLAVVAVFFIHVFTHLGQSIFLKKYTPGVVTAVLIALPYSLYTYYRLLDNGIITRVDIGWSLLMVLVLLPPILWVLMRSRLRYNQD